ncbi:hypothetical protein O3P69_001898 [Scylla paramamosain]|uniref:Chitin-binding type-2 domain-containing protein n=2 Tax=Scylla paramamosain TaxID=85552 RepID=A0AAW0V029_SCYPA
MVRETPQSLASARASRVSCLSRATCSHFGQMGATQCWIVVLAVVLGATAVLAAIPGPKNMRYPDNIVEPKVKCVKEGSFPHPRNCSWYYRCVDRMHVGFFWTYHFECEPGTVFSDELDQCVHPFLAEPPCGGQTTTITTEPTIIQCHGVPGTCKNYEICLPEKRTRYFCDKIRCPLRTPELSCAEGYSFDMDARQCDKIPEASTLCGVATNISITQQGQVPCSADNLRPMTDFVSRIYCSEYVFCDGNKFSGKKKLCTNYYECQRIGNKWEAFLRSCPPGLLYSYSNDKCEPKPLDSELC